MRADLKKQRTVILEQLLPHVPRHGWSWDAVRASGLERRDVMAVFPNRLPGVVKYFSTYIDEKLMEELDKIDITSLRIRERIETAVYTRFECLLPYKDAARQAASFWSVPSRNHQAPQITWKTADIIWKWTGDQSTDYNYYTKRLLLSGILSSTTLFWLNNRDMDKTNAFLHRRVENVMKINKFLRKVS